MSYVSLCLGLTHHLTNKEAYHTSLNSLPLPPGVKFSASIINHDNAAKEIPGDFDKDTLLRIADETMKAMEKGSYILGGSAEIFDLRTNVENLKARTTYYEPNSKLASWAQSPLQSRPSSTTKFWIVARSTLEAARWLLDKVASESPTAVSGDAIAPSTSRVHAVGVFNFASAANPGGGFLTGARATEESIVRSSTLYSSLTCPTGQEFYYYHQSITKGAKNDGYNSHAMIYSPSVMVFRDDSGGWIRPFEIDILSATAVNAGVVRQKRHHAIDRGQKTVYSEVEMEDRIRSTMKERMARVLHLFEIQGVKNLLLGSFGTGAYKNKVDVVVDLWAELLLGENSRFGRSFDRVVFGVFVEEINVKYAQRFGAEIVQ